jgi:hypothetical protein
MVISHTIPSSTVRLGDHVYVRGGFFKEMQREGIIVAGSDFNRDERWLIIEHRPQEEESNVQLQLVTLSMFKGSSSKLRHVLYDQGDVLLHHCKLSGTSYTDPQMRADIIVNNARILFELSQSSYVNKEGLKALIGEKYEKFAYICSSTDSRNWVIPLQLSQTNNQAAPENILIVPEQNLFLEEERMQNIQRDENADTTG